VSWKVASKASVHANAGKHAPWLRFLALLLALLALSAQQRTLSPVLRPMAPVLRLVAERAQQVERHALRADATPRVAPAPVFARAPSVSGLGIVGRAPTAYLASTGEVAGQVRQAVSHFHSKRRIPRMNSEEPPRA